MTRRTRHGVHAILGALALLAVLGAPVQAAAGPSSAEASLETQAFAEGQARVILPDVAQVAGGTVTLADVAQLEGPPELVERLGQVAVGPAPLPGRTRWVETAYLAVRFRQAGIDPNRVVVEGPERMALVTPAAPEHRAAKVQPPSQTTVEALPVVTRDERLTLEAVAGSVIVQVPARSLAPGRVGDRIRVVNLASGLEVEAVVVGPGRVRVEVGL